MPKTLDLVPTPCPSAEGTLSRQVLRAFVEVLARKGSREAVLREVGLVEADLSLGAPRIPRAEFNCFCERALAALNDPALGLHWGEGLEERSFGSLSHMLAHVGTLRRGFELAVQFESLICDFRIYEVVERADTMAIRMTDASASSPELTRFGAEVVFSAMLTVVRAFFAGTKPRAVRLAYAAPEYHAEYERVFGICVLFDQPCSELVFDRELLDRPSPHGDQALHEAVKTVAEQQLVCLTRSAPYAVRLREHLLASWPQRPDMEAASRALGISMRTLRRQLSGEGTSFRGVEYAALEVVAKRMLCEQNLTIQETAHEMGFSDAATFHRAFKTWTGLTPSAFREKAQNAPRNCR